MDTDTDTLPGPAGFACTAAASDTAPRAGAGGMCWQAPVRTGGLRRPLEGFKRTISNHRLFSNEPRNFNGDVVLLG